MVCKIKQATAKKQFELLKCPGWRWMLVVRCSRSPGTLSTSSRTTNTTWCKQNNDAVNNDTFSTYNKVLRLLFCYFSADSTPACDSKLRTCMACKILFIRLCVLNLKVKTPQLLCNGRVSNFCADNTLQIPNISRSGHGQTHMISESDIVLSALQNPLYSLIIIRLSVYWI